MYCSNKPAQSSYHQCEGLALVSRLATRRARELVCGLPPRPRAAGAPRVPSAPGVRAAAWRGLAAAARRLFWASARCAAVGRFSGGASGAAPGGSPARNAAERMGKGLQRRAGGMNKTGSCSGGSSNRAHQLCPVRSCGAALFLVARGEGGGASRILAISLGDVF